MPTVSMRQLLEAGVHFGHQTRRWNPKMRPFIFAERNGIHIIDLAQTVKRLDLALDAIRETTARGEQVLFVGTKKQAQEPIVQEAERAGQPYVTSRWLGGMLTNFVTIKKRLGLLEQLEARQLDGDFDRMTKKEAAVLSEELRKLKLSLGGIRKMRRLPGAVFIIDPARERIAVAECIKLEIPIIGTGDTNVDPDELDYIIPGNDDAIRAIRLLCSLIADAAIEGDRERAVRSDREPSPSRDGGGVAADELASADGSWRSLPPAEPSPSSRMSTRSRCCRAWGPPPRSRPRAGGPGRSRPSDPQRFQPGRGACATAAPDRRRTPDGQVLRERRRGASRAHRRRLHGLQRALEESDGDLDKAVVLLRERGLAAAAKQVGGTPARAWSPATSIPEGASASSSRSTARRTSSRGRTSSRSWCTTWPSRSPGSTRRTWTWSGSPPRSWRRRRPPCWRTKPLRRSRAHPPPDRGRPAQEVVRGSVPDRTALPRHGCERR